MAGIPDLQPLKHGKPSGLSSTTTDKNGDYTFSGLTAATYSVSETLPRHYNLPTPSTGSYTITLSTDQNSTGNNFGDHKRAKASVASAMRSSTPFAITSSPASCTASQADGSALLFGIQDKQDVFAN